MEIVLTQATLTALMADAAEIAVNSALSKAGLIKPFISKQDAYKAYGRAIVDRWILEGLVTPRKDGQASAKWRIDRAEIEAVAKASNRPSYLSVTERKQ